MQEIDVLLDTQTGLALEMVECDIRNKKAHDELQTYNDHKIFLYKHPFTCAYQYRSKQLSDLCNLKKTDLNRFMKKIASTEQNILRIKSNIRKKKYRTDDELSSWRENLSKAEIKLSILKELVT